MLTQETMNYLIPCFTKLQGLEFPKKREIHPERLPKLLHLSTKTDRTPPSVVLPRVKPEIRTFLHKTSLTFLKKLN